MRSYESTLAHGLGGRKGGLLALAGVSVCVWAGVFGLIASPAGASQTHLFEGAFGSDGTAGTHFQRPDALAVDQATGNIYVGDPYPAETVQRFDGAHEPEPFTGVSADVVGGRLTGFRVILVPQVAADATSHDVYVESGEPGSTRVRAFQADGEPQDFTKGPGAGSNELTGAEVCGVAVDANGDVYVSEFSTGVRVYAPSGEPLASVAQGGLCNLAVDSHGAVYAPQLESPEAGHSGPIVKLTPSVFPVTSSTTYESVGTFDASPSFAVAVDPATDHVYVDEGGQVAEYDEGDTRLGAFGGGGANALPAAGQFGAALAVNQVTGRVYVAQGNFEGQAAVYGPAVLVPDVATGAAGEVRPQGTVTLNGTVNPDGVALTACQFQYVDQEHYQPAAADPYVEGATASCVPAAGAIPSTGETPVSAAVEHLAPGTTYHFRLTAANTSAPNDGEDATFSTLPLPSIDSASVAGQTATSADLQAQINPGGVTTACRIEYGSGSSYGASAACEPASLEGTGEVPVHLRLQGLSPDVTYHWRILATSAVGTTTGADHEFVYDTAGNTLPDNRAYEMVTPPQKNGALIGRFLSVAGSVPLLAEGGSRVAMGTIQCFGDAAACIAARQPVGTHYLFTRTSSGWTNRPLAPPATQFEVSTDLTASPDTGMGLFVAPAPPMFEQDFYMRRPDGSNVDIGPVTPSSEGPRGNPASGRGYEATGDFSHVVFRETEGVWPFGVASDDEGTQAYEFVGADNHVPALVGVSGGLESHDLLSACGTAVGPTGGFGTRNSGYQAPGNMSANGSTVYFTAETCSTGTGANAGIPVPANTLYARIDQSRTVKISERSPGDCTDSACLSSPPGGADLASASDDGSKAFFLSGQQLTNNASEGGNLYEYDFDNPTGHNLIDVSAGDVSGGGPRVVGVMSVSADGSHVYFVAQGVLTRVANGQGQVAQSSADNLYVFERDARYPQGHMAFVTALSDADASDWSSVALGGVNVTPDGGFLVFLSHGALTADGGRADRAAQVYRYDASTGELLRISIGQEGFNDNGNGSPAPACEGTVCPSFDARTASPVVDLNTQPIRRDPTMSHDGSYVFFESPVGLTPGALNEVPIGTLPSVNGIETLYAENVYEWHEGRVALISDGRDTAAILGQPVLRLIGSDASGANVFFFTADSLTAQDTDTQTDLYDARICTNAEPCVSPPGASLPCAGEGCHGTPPAAPGVPGAPSATFNGPGNPRPSAAVTKRRATRRAPRRCAKGRRRVHGRCVKMRAGSRAGRVVGSGRRGK